MSAFTACELLYEKDTWFCNICKDHVRISKKTQLWSTPKILILQLKRFEYVNNSPKKLFMDISFPLEDLDMSPFFADEVKVDEKYDLFAVAVCV